MKIAQVAPLCESVPPKLYGGTERVVSYLTETLVAMGHEVTLYATADSVTRARLRPMAAQALRLDPRSLDPVADHIFELEQVFQDRDEFDMIHSHVDYLGYPLLRRINIPHATTLHGQLGISNLRNVFSEFKDEPVIPISNHQRSPFPDANWQGTVYHGLPANQYRFHPEQGRYLAFLGRASPEKRLDRAIEIARRSDLPLKIAARANKSPSTSNAAPARSNSSSSTNPEPEWPPSGGKTSLNQKSKIENRKSKILQTAEG